MKTQPYSRQPAFTASEKVQKAETPKQFRIYMKLKTTENSQTGQEIELNKEIELYK